MAECVRYFCRNCDYSIESWSDGNPYFFDEHGQKQYVHHPSTDFGKCVGNDADFLCLNCSEDFTADASLPNPKCPKCFSRETIDFEKLKGKQCPQCKKGKFKIDQEFRAVS